VQIDAANAAPGDSVVILDFDTVRDVFGPYATILRIPGALAFSAASFIGRLPISMYGLGFVLLVQPISHSYAIAGLFSATFTIAAAAGGPFTSRWADRWGQNRVSPWLTLVATVSLVASVLLIVLMKPGPHASVNSYNVMSPSVIAALLFTVIAGASVPNMGSYVRARWRAVVDSEQSLHTAFAFESVIDEVIFVVGPPLATFIAVATSGAWSLALCAILLVIGTGLLAVQKRTEPKPMNADHHRGKLALLYPGMLAVAVVAILMGVVFGAFEVVTVAFATEAGHRGQAGVLLAFYAFGSLLSGVVVGLIHFKTPLIRRLLWQTAFFALMCIPLPFVTSIPQLAAAAFAAGLAISPLLISAFTLVEKLVPETRFTEGITWMTTGLGLGVAIGAPLAGRIVDVSQASNGYYVVLGAAGLSLLAVAVTYASVSRAIGASEAFELPA
jgi:MFS family permease